MAKCIIVGAGDFYEKKLNINEEDLVIAADGGYDHLFKISIIPDIVIGDFDSICSKDFSNSSVITLQKEKNSTDLYEAIQTGLKRGFKDFQIYGALGGRIEHSIANIQILSSLVGCATAKILDRELEMFVLSNDKKVYPPTAKGYLSIFAVSSDAVVTLQNLKYELNNYRLTNVFPLGIDNEFINKQAVITAHKGKILVICRNGD